MKLLQQVGITPVQRPPVVDEVPLAGESHEALVLRLAREKANGIALHPGEEGVILAADTIVLATAADGTQQILGKPQNVEDNAAMLRQLSGVKHSVVTGFCVRFEGNVRVRAVRTDVFFRDLASNEIDAYAKNGEGHDKAGGYGIQGVAAGFVERIEGSYANVVGLPVCEVIEELRNVSMFVWPQ